MLLLPLPLLLQLLLLLQLVLFHYPERVLRPRGPNEHLTIAAVDAATAVVAAAAVMTMRRRKSTAAAHEFTWA